MYRWNHRTRHYETFGGAILSWDGVRSDTDAFIQSYANDVFRDVSDNIEPFDQDKFFAIVHRIRNEIEYLHAAATIIALGGLEATTQFAYENDPIWQEEERFLASQLRFFDNLVYSIFIGTVAISMFPRRASNYALAAFGTYERIVRLRESVVKEYGEERRILTAKESCATCVTEAGKAWQAFGTLRSIGDSECLFNCRCYFEYRKVG